MRNPYLALLESAPPPLESLPFWGASLGPEIKSNALFIYETDSLRTETIASPLSYLECAL